jgi:hypothetical protein
MQRYAVYLYLENALRVWVVPPLIIRSANNCIYSIWYLSHRYCYLPLSWKSWNWFEFSNRCDGSAIAAAGNQKHM